MSHRRTHRNLAGFGAAVAVVLALLVTFAAAPAADAQQCRIGTGLGATLLVPYFEYDPDGSMTTFVSVVNESNEAALARVILWTDWAVPTLGFDVYLTPFDTQSLNVRDLFLGNIPSTGEGVDLSGFPFCEDPQFEPRHPNPALSSQQRAQLLAYHTGVAGPVDDRCAGAFYDDGLARGYITIDVVDECGGIQTDDSLSPAFGGYFQEGGDGEGAIAVAENVLWGNYHLVDPTNAFAHGSEAIALWADPAQFTADPGFTFYGRFSGYDAQDERVPLPSLWASRFLNGGPFTGGTDLVVWRDVGTQESTPVTCGTTPSWFPLPQSFVVARDESGNPANRVELGEEEALFPLATQRVPVSTLGIPYDFGRIQIAFGEGPGVDNPMQAWVDAVMSADGLYSVGVHAKAVNDLCEVTP